MKTFLTIVLLSASAVAFAGSCGIPPIPPIGCSYICQCDGNGNNCQFVTICR